MPTIMREQRSRIWWFIIWFCVNLIIFVACYLNYRLQLKHRYLYKTLNVGLCFSRAAAMVINFNLLLVWLPMCKYSLTKLAYLTKTCLRHQLEASSQLLIKMDSYRELRQPSSEQLFAGKLLQKMKLSIHGAILKIQYWISTAKLNFLTSFLISVDHCKSLHTICATTITIASIIHTSAHLLNVINFSKNFDPLLSNLNMASYRGQNPLELLISVPGITGCLMMIILILMSLSSVDFIRYSSYDLFQIFHRLSVMFVLLLLLHPSSHILKEQSNVERHHPDYCYSKMAAIAMRITTTPKELVNLTQVERSRRIVHETTAAPSHALVPANVSSEQTGRSNNLKSRPFKSNVTTSSLIYNNNNNSNNNNTVQQPVQYKTTTDLNLNDIRRRSVQEFKVTPIETNGQSSERVDNAISIERIAIEEKNVDEATGVSSYKLCEDTKPLFVAQSSICWYVLSIGLSCYLFDLILRKQRRSRSQVQLLDVSSDCEGNLIELILSNNHKRFSHWLPGQFVYLNCPQIAKYEWHPFTISSMDNRSRQFTLHIKTGGDWTRKLRERLESRQSSMSLFQQVEIQQQVQFYQDINRSKFSNSLEGELVLPGLESYNRFGQLQIECTKLSSTQPGAQDYDRNDCVKLNMHEFENERNLQTISHRITDIPKHNSSLELFIDGPFHSPFERLLEQQVSVCIANGVGWTAFSSIFQCLTNNLNESNDQRDWWARWRNFAKAKASSQLRASRLPNTKLHLMIIVTSIEQLRPFYNMAVDYFKRIVDECQVAENDQMNPVKEITAFITRSTKEDEALRQFLTDANLNSVSLNNNIRVNEVFTINFGKPRFDLYLEGFRNTYSDSEKLSIYCCGSYQVKKTVREICYSLNRLPKLGLDSRCAPRYAYHEENF